MICRRPYSSDGTRNFRCERSRSVPIPRPQLASSLGAPKQEIWLATHRLQLKAKVAVAAGGTLDFLASRQTRAPLWIQSLRREWLHRLMSNPRRLAARYIMDAVVFPALVTWEHYAGRCESAV